MLRRMESTGQGALGWRGADWEDAARLGRRALGWAALAGAMFLLCRARVGWAGEGARLAPFAMAFLAAALLAGRGAAALLAGCLAGAMGGSLSTFDLRLPVGAAIVLGGSIAWDFARPAVERRLRGEARRGRGLRARLGILTGHEAKSPAPNRLARSPNDGAVCAALAGAGVLLPGLLLTEGPLWPEAAEATAASLAAVAAAPFFKAALEERPRRMGRDGRIGACVLLGALCMGLARLSVPLAACAGAGLALMMAPAGSLAGIGFGASLAAATGDARLLSLLAACGATAQLCRSLARPARCLAACAAALVAGLALNLAPAVTVGAMLAALLTLPMPEEWERYLPLMVDSTADPRRQAEAARRRAAGRVSALAAAFGEAADGTFQAAGRAMEALAEALAEPPRRPRPRLGLQRGAAWAPMRPDAPSGDCHLICPVDGARVLALVSDGMGSGPAAARESALAARLLARLLRAGLSLEDAAELANALMLGQGGEDMFATADALVLDMESGAAEFLKLAACPTLVLRNGEALRVAGGRLPLGILAGVRPKARRARLLPGDLVLLASDGVYDALGEEALQALLGEWAHLPPRRIAEAIVAAAEAACERRDDMTAVCLRIVQRS